MLSSFALYSLLFKHMVTYMKMKNTIYYTLKTEPVDAQATLASILQPLKTLQVLLR